MKGRTKEEFPVVFLLLQLVKSRDREEMTCWHVCWEDHGSAAAFPKKGGGTPCLGAMEREPVPGKETAIHLLHSECSPCRIKLGKNFKIIRKPVTVGLWWGTESWTWPFYVTVRDSLLNTILWSWVWFWSQWSQGQNILCFNWKQKQAPTLTCASADRI